MAESRNEKRGYGRSWKRWLLIYLAVAVVIYGLVYLIQQSGGGSGGGGLYG
jgi:preprotein translocase subunit SecG